MLKEMKKKNEHNKEINIQLELQEWKIRTATMYKWNKYTGKNEQPIKILQKKKNWSAEDNFIKAKWSCERHREKDWKTNKTNKKTGLSGLRGTISNSLSTCNWKYQKEMGERTKTWLKNIWGEKRNNDPNFPMWLTTIN